MSIQNTNWGYQNTNLKFIIPTTKSAVLKMFEIPTDPIKIPTDPIKIPTSTIKIPITPFQIPTEKVHNTNPQIHHFKIPTALSKYQQTL